MALPSRKSKLNIAVITVMTTILSLIVDILLRNSGESMGINDIERQSTYKVTLNGAKIVAFNSIPKEVITSLKEYIKDNGYNGKDI